MYRSTEHYKGQYSLGFRIEREQRPSGVSEKSKIEINVSRHDDDRLNQRYGGRYILTNASAGFLGFALKLDEHQYEPPTRWLLHVQVWQCCSNETQPPLTFQVLPNAKTGADDIRFVVLKRNDAYLDRGMRSDNGERLPFADGKDFVDLHKGEWHRFIFLLKPNPEMSRSGQTNENTGLVELWIDGQFALRHRGAWGYTPNPGRGITGRYAVKLGVYRAAQNTLQKFFIDNIRWGSTFESANPDNP
jgi:hypothetical protein